MHRKDLVHQKLCILSDNYFCLIVNLFGLLIYNWDGISLATTCFKITVYCTYSQERIKLYEYLIYALLVHGRAILGIANALRRGLAL